MRSQPPYHPTLATVCPEIVLSHALDPHESFGLPHLNGRYGKLVVPAKSSKATESRFCGDTVRERRGPDGKPSPPQTLGDISSSNGRLKGQQRPARKLILFFAPFDRRFVDVLHHDAKPILFRKGLVVLTTDCAHLEFHRRHPARAGTLVRRSGLSRCQEPER